MDRRVAVELFDAPDDRLFAGIGGKFVRLGMQADFAARLDLVAHVQARRRIIADDDDCQPRRDAARFQRVDPLLPFAPDVAGDCVAVDYFGGHRL